MFPDPAVTFALGRFQVHGFSAASRATFYALPALDLILDLGWCIEPMRPLSRLFLSHFHQDHSLALPTWVAWRLHAAPETPPHVYTHREAVAPAQEILATFGRAEQRPLPCSIRAFEEGERVDLGAGYTLEAFETTHHIPTLGLLLFKVERRLRAEHWGRTNQEIRALLQQGTAVHEEVEVPVLCYTSDTTSELFDRRPDLLEAEVLITECTHLDGYLEYNPEDASQLGEKEGVTHCHIRPLSKRLNGFRGKVLALGHMRRHYEGCALRPYLLPRLPPEQRPKLVVVPYRDGPFPEVSTPEVVAAPEVSADPVELEFLAREAWEVREHPGYFGRRKAEIKARLAAQYPGYERAWEWEGGLITHRSALQLYEDAYLEFFRKNPEVLDWLLERALDVYDTSPDNIGSGLDYLAQRPEEPTHLQDIAIRRVVRRLGRRFGGKTLLEIRGIRSEGYALNPGQVPFHRREQIRQPGWEADWALPGSIESFWQSNKVVITPTRRRDAPP